MSHPYLKFVILFILLMTQPIKIAYADITDNYTTNNFNTIELTTDNSKTSYGSVRNKYAVNRSKQYKPTINKSTSNNSKIGSTKTDNSTDFSSLFLNVGFATDLFITNGPFDLDATTLLFCGNIDVGKIIYKAIGIGVGYSNCNGFSSSSHKVKLQLLLQRMIDKNKLGLTPYLTAGIKYQSLKLRDSNEEAFNAVGTNASIGIRYNIYSFLISANIDFTYTLFFRESSPPTHALITSASIKLGVLF